MHVNDLDQNEINKLVKESYAFVKEKLFNSKTNIVYDFVFKANTDLPTPDEIGMSFPNPCGYGTGMEDGMINGALALFACLSINRYVQDHELQQFIHCLVLGLQSVAMQGKDGFLPRAVCPIDGKSHYIDSSIDQYTMFFYSAYIYTHCALCTKEENLNFQKILTKICRRAEKNVVKETGYDMLREDGGESKVTKFWGDKTYEFAAFCRLPMMYLLTYALTKDLHWYDKYREIRDASLVGMSNFEEPWHLYVFQQMECSLIVLRDLEDDPFYKIRYEQLIKKIGAFVAPKMINLSSILKKRKDINEPFIPFRNRPLYTRDIKEWKGLPTLYAKRADNETFFLAQDVANVVFCMALGGVQITSEIINAFLTVWRKIDFEKHTRCLPLYFLCACCICDLKETNNDK